MLCLKFLDLIIRKNGCLTYFFNRAFFFTHICKYATETGTDRKIIIENQLEDTDHDHLGKLITYASGKGADVVIWVVKHAREEHKAAIEWLNNHTDDKIGFFLCEI